jgi:hypothetical protein
MPALAVNSGTRAWEIAAASTARPRQSWVVLLTLGLAKGAGRHAVARPSNGFTLIVGIILGSWSSRRRAWLTKCAPRHASTPATLAGRFLKVSMSAGRPILRRLPSVLSAYRNRVSGLLTIRIKGALRRNYSFDTLPWIDRFAFNAEIICLVLQNKSVAARG